MSLTQSTLGTFGLELRPNIDIYSVNYIDMIIMTEKSRWKKVESDIYFLSLLIIGDSILVIATIYGRNIIETRTLGVMLIGIVVCSCAILIIIENERLFFKTLEKTYTVSTPTDNNWNESYNEILASLVITIRGLKSYYLLFPLNRLLQRFSFYILNNNDKAKLIIEQGENIGEIRLIITPPMKHYCTELDKFFVELYNE